MLDKEAFFNKYSVEEYFQNSELDWKTLEDIYDNYVTYKDELDECCSNLEKFLIDNFRTTFSKENKIPLHSIL